MFYFDDELTLHGLRDAAYGHPIFDLGGTGVTMIPYADSGSDEKCRFGTGLDCATARRFYLIFIRRYFDCQTDEEAQTWEFRVRMVWLLRYYTTPVIYQTASDRIIKRSQERCRKEFFPHIDQWIDEMADVWPQFD